MKNDFLRNIQVLILLLYLATLWYRTKRLKVPVGYIIHGLTWSLHEIVFNITVSLCSQLGWCWPSPKDFNNWSIIIRLHICFVLLASSFATIQEKKSLRRILWTGNRSS